MVYHADTPSERPPRALGHDSDEHYRSPGRTPLDTRGPWSAEFREDLARYRAHHGGSLVRTLLLEQGVWALLQYRISSGVHRSRLPKVVKLPLLLLCVLGHKLTEALLGISLPYRAELMPGIYIGHFGPVLVSAGVHIGAGCNLSQGVSIGVSGRGKRRGVPHIGQRVYIGAGAVVAGAIVVGDEAVIGANSLVTRDVAPHTTVIGVPASQTSSHGTPGMGLHMRPRTDRFPAQHPFRRPWSRA